MTAHNINGGVAEAPQYTEVIKNRPTEADEGECCVGTANALFHEIK